MSAIPTAKDERRYFASFSYQATPWIRSRRHVAKVEWRPGELYSGIGFIVTDLSRSARWLVALHTRRGVAERGVKEGKNAMIWTQLSGHSFRATAVRLRLHSLACNLANIIRTRALPGAVGH